MRCIIQKAQREQCEVLNGSKIIFEDYPPYVVLYTNNVDTFGICEFQSVTTNDSTTTRLQYGRIITAYMSFSKPRLYVLKYLPLPRTLNPIAFCIWTPSIVSLISWPRAHYIHSRQSTIRAIRHCQRC